MIRSCRDIHPILQPDTCEHCAAYITAVSTGGRLKKGPAKLFGDSPTTKKPCDDPVGVEDATFLEKPDKLNQCKDGSGSDCSGSGSGSTGGCKGGGGNCGVAAVYCNGNQLVVIYSTPIVPPVTGNHFCVEVTDVFYCDEVVLGTKYCSVWPANSTVGDYRPVLCQNGYGIITETIVSGPYPEEPLCYAACT